MTFSLSFSRKAAPLLRLCLAGVATLSPSLLHAQNSGLSGRITDTTGASIVHATVKITNLDTGVSNQITTNQDGLYSLPALVPGHYRVVASAPGFTTLRRTGVMLSVDTNSRIDLLLQTGGVDTSVEVVADVDLVQANDAASENYITSQQFDDLSLVQQDRMRNPAAFVYQTPGVQGNISVNGSDYVGATNVILVHGGQLVGRQPLAVNGAFQVRYVTCHFSRVQGSGFGV